MHECAIAQIKAFVYLILNSNNNIRVFLYPIPISAVYSTGKCICGKITFEHRLCVSHLDHSNTKVTLKWQVDLRIWLGSPAYAGWDVELILKQMHSKTRSMRGILCQSVTPVVRKSTTA